MASLAQQADGMPQAVQGSCGVVQIGPQAVQAQALGLLWYRAEVRPQRVDADTGRSVTTGAEGGFGRAGLNVAGGIGRGAAEEADRNHDADDYFHNELRV